MIHPRLAGRYAKSLLDFSREQQQTHTVLADMQFISSTLTGSNDLTMLLKSPVVKGDQKMKVLNALFGSHVQPVTLSFLHLLLDKHREAELADIAESFILLYNEEAGIHRVKLTTAVPVSEAVKHTFIQKVKSETGFTTIELETAVDSALIGGFRLEYDNKLVDTSVARDLSDVKKQFSQNSYVQRLH